MFMPPRFVLLFLLTSLPFFACDKVNTPSEDDSESGGAGGEGGSPHDEAVLDDFEDGDLTNALGTNWYTYTDQGNSGASTLTGPNSAPSIVAPGGYESEYGLSIIYTLAQGEYEWDPFVGFGTTLPASFDLSDYQGLSFYYRGASHTVRFESSNVTDYDFYMVRVPAASEWTRITVPFVTLTQDGYGTPVEWSPETVTALSWHIGGPDGTSGTLELDNIRFEKDAPVDRGPKNLTIQPAAPPAQVELEDIVIPGELQERAMEQLNRGYNVTNWLEDGRFDGTFRFDEDFVARLAENGFWGLRLPIDLDLYVTSESEDGTEVVVDDDLWLVLDNFATWTSDHGLSLTIDYHQYDASFTFNDEVGVNRAIALWKTVAAHFATNPRDDLYYELLNEPELSVGSTRVLNASAWTPVAERMIAAIRGEDDQHTIIFGDVNWYGIQQLSAREPFGDDNIVYAFHFYEPFIFTHQGASWAEQTSTKNVPFPYSPETWSEYSSDFGLGTTQPSWIWDQFRSYYRNGTVEALYNQIARAKSWGVTHGVPVICNEFGAYDRTARTEDRVRYYEALIGIFEDLEIPWQHWFMIMDAHGNIPTEYVHAFRLND